MVFFNLSLHNQEKTWEIAPPPHYNKFKDHYQMIRGMAGAKQARTITTSMFMVVV